jgi:hypothetical protein
MKKKHLTFTCSVLRFKGQSVVSGCQEGAAAFDIN